jgi:hypothetical protein
MSARTWSPRRTLPTELAFALRTSREQRGLGLRRVAALAGIGHGYLWLLERGERCPSRLVAEAWVAAIKPEGDLAERLLAAAVTDAGRCFKPAAGSAGAGSGQRRRQPGDSGERGLANQRRGTARLTGGASLSKPGHRKAER